MTIPLAAPRFGDEEIAAVRSVLESGMVADGPEVRRFEDAFAGACDVDHGVATANGTAALHAALEALQIGEGDRVVTTPFSFVASANAIRLAGATPVFADVDSATFNLDPEAAERAVRATGADAILVVHLYGLPAAMGPLRDLAEDEDLILIEDAAQAAGARYRGEPVGSFGDAAAFSFYPTKNVTTGEGGMVVTDREAVAERAASYVNHGRTGEERYGHVRVGHNYRMTSVAAAIGRAQLERLPEWVATRRGNARRLTSAVRESPGVYPPTEPDDCFHAYNQYTVVCEDRERVRRHLEARDVGTGVYYPTSIPRLEAYEGFDAETPIADRAAEEVLSLPVHPGLSGEDLAHVVEAIRGVEVRAS